MQPLFGIGLLGTVSLGRRIGQSAIGVPKLFGIHLVLSRLSTWHLCRYPGIWLSTAYGITGDVLLLEPTWTIVNLYNLSGIAAHHIASSIVGLVVRIFHMCVHLIGTVLAEV